MTSPAGDRAEAGDDQQGLADVVRERAVRGFAEAAAVVRGKAEGRRRRRVLSRRGQRRGAGAGRADGHWQALVDAGAIAVAARLRHVHRPGRGTIKAGEVGISATNRNFEGRMGDRNGLVYLGSPAVVAASALAGYICSPTNIHRSRRAAPLIRRAQGKPPSAVSVEIIDGFPPSVRGRLLFPRPRQPQHRRHLRRQAHLQRRS